MKLFLSHARADYFYQIKSGHIAMVTTNEDGKQFTQGMFSEGESFGDPVLFLDVSYPASAIALEDCIIYKLFKDAFFEMIKKYPEILIDITKRLSELLYFKSKMSTEISLHSPEHRILTLLDHIKLKKEPEKINIMRQQIADLTALRVETTVISFYNPTDVSI